MNILPTLLIIACSINQSKNSEKYAFIKIEAIKAFTENKDPKTCIDMAKKYIECDDVLKENDKEKIEFVKLIYKDMITISLMMDVEGDILKNNLKSAKKISSSNSISNNDLIEIERLRSYFSEKFGKISFVNYFFSVTVCNYLLTNDKLNTRQVYVNDIIEPFINSNLKSNPESCVFKYIKIQMALKNCHSEGLLNEIKTANEMAKKCTLNYLSDELQYYEALARYYNIENKHGEAIKTIKSTERYKFTIDENNLYLVYKFYKSVFNSCVAVGEIEDAVMVQKFIIKTMFKCKNDIVNEIIENELTCLKLLCIKYKIKDETEEMAKNENFTFKCIPEKAIELCDSGVVKFNKNDYKGAIDDATLALKLNSVMVQAYELRGKCFIALGEFDQAIGDLSRAIELDHNAADYYYSRSVCWLALGKHEIAMLDANKAAKLENNNYNFHYFKGFLKIEMSDFNGAILDLNRSIELNKENKSAYINRGISHYEIGKFTIAEGDFLKALSLDHNDYWATLGYSRTLEKTGDLVGASSGYKRCIDLGKDKADAYLWLAIMYSESQKEEYRNAKEAVLNAKRGMELQGKKINWLGYKAMASAMAASKEFGEAIKFQEKSINLLKNSKYTSKIELDREENELKKYKIKLDAK